jgi:hypothetical protein
MSPLRSTQPAQEGLTATGGAPGGPGAGHGSQSDTDRGDGGWIDIATPTRGRYARRVAAGAVALALLLAGAFALTGRDRWGAEDIEGTGEVPGLEFPTDVFAEEPPANHGEGSTDVWSYYGNPWTPFHLANIPIEGPISVSYRFLAKESGPMTGFQNYFTGNSDRDGYAAGSGGVVRARLVPDDGDGLPDLSTILAELTWVPGLSDGRSSAPDESYSIGHPTNFADKYWPEPPTLVAGDRYHIVFDNTDPSPETNWISLDTGITFDTGERGPLAPPTPDWGVTIDPGTGDGFAEDTKRQYSGGTGRYEVNLLILMADGANYGNAYMESGAAYAIAGSSGVRQVFEPDESIPVSMLSAYAAGTGVLRATLVADETTVGSWTAEIGAGGWAHYSFPIGELTLSAGTSYALEFSADSGSMEMLTFRDGSDGLGYNFKPGGSWSDGHSQVTEDGDNWANTFFTYADLNGVAFEVAGA